MNGTTVRQATGVRKLEIYNKWEVLVVNISYVNHSGKIVSKVSFSMHSANNMDGNHIRNML